MYLSIGMAALFLGVSVSTLRRWEHEEKLLPSHRTLGGHRRYNKSKGIAVIILEEKSQDSFEVELSQDAIELMTVFCAKLYDKRSHQNKRQAA